jgi:hypothetical protein
LIGHELVTSFLAADMRMFGFGTPVANGSGVTADYSLHLQCPWRIDDPAGTLVTSHDLFIYAGPDPHPPDWDYEMGHSRQEIALEALLGPRIPLGDGWFHRSGLRVATVQHSPATGDLTLSLGDGRAMRVFPLGTASEQWRLFAPGSARGHFVQGGDA